MQGNLWLLTCCSGILCNPLYSCCCHQATYIAHVSHCCCCCCSPWSCRWIAAMLSAGVCGPLTTTIAWHNMHPHPTADAAAAASFCRWIAAMLAAGVMCVSPTSRLVGSTYTPCVALLLLLLLLLLLPPPRSLQVDCCQAGRWCDVCHHLTQSTG
jgi:hypothetical protein